MMVQVEGWAMADKSADELRRVDVVYGRYFLLT